MPAVLRRQVFKRAHGCCEYCLMPEPLSFARHEVDHILSRKHAGPTTAENLALSCILCNKHKGSDISSVDPESGEVVPLFNPRKDRWLDHFKMYDAQIVGLTPEGRATSRLLQFNRTERTAERRLFLETGLYQVLK